MNVQDLVIVNGQSRSGVQYGYELGILKCLENNKQTFPISVEMKFNGSVEEFSEKAVLPVTQSMMSKLTDLEIEHNCYNNELKRQALGTIAVEDLNMFCVNAAAALEKIDVRSSSFVKRIGLSESPRFEIGTCAAGIEVRNLSKNRVTAIGLYFEHPNTDAYNNAFSRIKDKDRYIVWVYHTIKGKALTVLRKFLIDSILFYQKPQS